MHGKRQFKDGKSRVDGGSSPAAVSSTAPPPRTERQTEVFQSTKMCKFHLQGACLRGADCKYAHSVLQLKATPDLSRTKLCKTLLATGTCNDPKCSYAHTKAELRPMPSRTERPVATHRTTLSSSSASTSCSDFELLRDPVKVPLGLLSVNSSSFSALSSLGDTQEQEFSPSSEQQGSAETPWEQPGAMEGLESIWYGGMDGASGMPYNMDYSAWQPDMGSADDFGFGMGDPWNWAGGAGGYGLDPSSSADYDYAELQAAVDFLLASSEGGAEWGQPSWKPADKKASMAKSNKKSPLDSFEPARVYSSLL